MTATNNLNLSLIEQSQAQKEVTVNSALVKIDAILNRGAIDKDLAAPPGSPASGDLYIIAAGAAGAWSGKDKNIGYYYNGVWNFLAPNEGMQIWVNDENIFYVYDGATWIKASARSLDDLTDVAISSVGNNQLLQYNGTNFVNTSNVDNIGRMGVNTVSDSTNKLAVKSSAVLFDHDGTNSQVKVNKNASADTASHLFQNNFSGRAEFGLIGDDDFQVKVSPDGSTFYQSYVVDRNNGNIYFKKEVSVDGDFRGKSPIVSVSGSKTLALTDANSFQKCTSASSTAITIPANSSVAFVLGTEVSIYQEGSGAVSVAAGGGVTINSRNSFLNISARYGVVHLKKMATDSWVLWGDLA